MTTISDQLFFTLRKLGMPDATAGFNLKEFS